MATPKIGITAKIPIKFVPVIFRSIPTTGLKNSQRCCATNPLTIKIISFILNFKINVIWGYYETFSCF